MLTVNELFSGIGSQSAALERLEIDFKVVGIAEIDKYAIKSYEAIHGQVRNYGDISTIEKLDYADFWTYSFPCQDISVAGNQKGINENTRSGLLYQVERLLEVSKSHNELPKYLMLENVKNLVGKKFKPQFDEWLQKLDQLGYNTYWQVLNAKNYGIPQNRERVFAISIRKDIDTGYEFPIEFDNGKRLKDILETEVDEKFYLSEDKVKLFAKQGKVNFSGAERKIASNDIIKEFDIPKEVLNDNERQRRVYNPIGISPTVLARTDSNKITTGFRIRKLTPLECYRLMGFTDEQFYKAEQVNSNSQLYKQAGNSIVVDVLYYIFKNLFIDKPINKNIESVSLDQQMSIEDFIGGQQ